MCNSEAVKSGRRRSCRTQACLHIAACWQAPDSRAMLVPQAHAQASLERRGPVPKGKHSYCLESGPHKEVAW